MKNLSQQVNEDQRMVNITAERLVGTLLFICLLSQAYGLLPVKDCTGKGQLHETNDGRKECCISTTCRPGRIHFVG